MEKVIRDGKVAVAVSYGFGAGWSTWEGVNPMDAEFNKIFIDGTIDEAKALAKEKGHYDGGIEDIEIVWVSEGTQFVINEYDGSESIQIITPDLGYTA